jgi:hypothetical protein
MNNSHARRAKPSPPHTAGRRGWLVWAAVPLAVIAPVVAYMAYMGWHDPADDTAGRSTPEAIEAVIKYMKFDPLLPPSRLRGPGAIYAVVDSGSYWKVCDADPKLVHDVIHSSPVPNQTRTKLENAGFSVDGHVLDTLNASLGVSKIVSIEYRMSNVSISEIAMRDLYVIQQKLLNDKNCDDMVGELLKQKEMKVCPGYAVLTASTSYKVHTDATIGSGAETKMPIIEAVKRQIELATKGEIKLTDAHELVGQDLYYGIKLSPVCLTPNTATAPSRLDDAGEQPSVQLVPQPAPQEGA